MAGSGSPRERISNALELGDRPFVGDISRVQRRFWFNQDDVDFFVGDGAVLHARGTTTNSPSLTIAS